MTLELDDLAKGLTLKATKSHSQFHAGVKLYRKYYFS
jgi:hypothetical protein